MITVEYDNLKIEKDIILKELQNIIIKIEEPVSIIEKEDITINIKEGENIDEIC